MALNPFNAGLPEGPGSGHFGEINCADCPAIELPPYSFSFFFVDFPLAEYLFFLRPNTWAHYPIRIRAAEGKLKDFYGKTVARTRTESAMECQNIFIAI